MLLDTNPDIPCPSLDSVVVSSRETTPAAASGSVLRTVSY